MNGFDQESKMEAAAASVPSSESVRASDRRIWLVALPVAWVVIYASLLTQRGHSRYLALLDLGAAVCTQGKYEAAEAVYAEAVRLRPEHPEGHNRLGTVLYTQGKYEAAVAQFTEALRLNSNYADAHYNLGVALQNKGHYPAAELHYAEASRLRPGYVAAHTNLGNVLNAQGKHAAATIQFTEALRLNPGDADAHNSLGTILSHQKKFAEAEAHFSEAIRLDRGAVQAHYNLGLVFSHLGKYEAAVPEFAEAIRLQPGDPRPYSSSAMIMATCPESKFRDGKKAVQLATRSCELTQWKNPIILDTLAAAQAEAGYYDAAVKSQTKAIELLTDEREKADYHSRLVRYQAKKTYRQVPSEPRPN